MKWINQRRLIERIAYDPKLNVSLIYVWNDIEWEAIMVEEAAWFQAVGTSTTVACCVHVPLMALLHRCQTVLIYGRTNLVPNNVAEQACARWYCIQLWCHLTHRCSLLIQQRKKRRWSHWGGWEVLPTLHMPGNHSATTRDRPVQSNLSPLPSTRPSLIWPLILDFLPHPSLSLSPSLCHVSAPPNLSAHFILFINLSSMGYLRTSTAYHT